MKAMLYMVSIWDMDRQRFVAYATRVRKWRLRKSLRTLYGRGYSNVSILVERRD